ncbi:MAG: chemotaxis protein [Campylobacterales bacterium]
MTLLSSSIDRITSLHKNNELQLLCFRLEEGGTLYAVNVFKVREIVRYRGTITQVVHDPGSILLGVVTIRNEIMPILDLRRWLYQDRANPEKNLVKEGIKGGDYLLMICEFSQFVVAIRIYESDRILPRHWSQIEAHNDSINYANPKINNRTRYFDGSIVLIVDVEKMLAEIFPWIVEEKVNEIEVLKPISTDKIVLLAEDSPVAMKMMRSILDKLQLRYHAFINGQQLLDYLFESKEPETIGAIITDLEMPVASGFEVIKQVKGNNRFSHIPIIVNSSMSGRSNEEMAKSLNADDFISKSNPREIEAAMRRYLG